MLNRLEMPARAQLYIVGVVVLGATAMAYALSHWQVPNPAQFVAYLLVALLASALKVNLPTITGTMSVNSLFVLVSIVQLTQAETMVIGLEGVLIQCLWRPKAPAHPVRVVFSIAANAAAIAAAYLVFDRFLPAQNLEGIRVLAVACTYFLVNTALVAAVVSLTERRPVVGIWLDCYAWCFPYYLGGAGITWISTILTREFDWQVSLVLLPVVYFVYRSYKLYLQRLSDEKKHVEAMAGLHLRTIEALAFAIEAKDHTTHDHLRRVRVYALELGTRMGLSELDLQSLRAAALLHDIGKLAVPEHIISKPGKLTPEEFEKMKIHPSVGAQILEQVQFPYPVAPIVLSHHEKWDGTGYPNGLKGEEIPLGARILSAVDALDALASDRQYRKAMPLEQAMSIVAADSGRTFDPAVIAILSSCYVELERKAVQEPLLSARLDVEPFILKGGAPATGFEESSGTPVQAVNQPAPASELAISAAQARQEIQELYEWCRSAPGCLTLAETLAVFTVRLRQLVPHDAIAFYQRRGGFLEPAFVGGDNRKLFSSLSIPYGEGLSGWVAENRRALLNGNPSVEAGYLNDPAKFSTLRSALAVPLETASGTVGVLALYRTERDAFSAADLRILTAASSRIAMVMEEAGAVSPVVSAAQNEPLPDTRQLFLRIEAEVKIAQTAGSKFALILCDLDRFREVSHRFGRDTADAVLRELGTGLRGFFRRGEMVAHLGGDEFGLLLPDATESQVQQCLESLRTFVTLAGRKLPDFPQLTHSVGIAWYPNDGEDAESLLARAEIGLLRAKRLARAVPEHSRATLPEAQPVAPINRY